MEAEISTYARVSQDRFKVMGLMPKTKFVFPTLPPLFIMNATSEDRNYLSRYFPTPFSNMLKYNVCWNVLFRELLLFWHSKIFDRLSGTCHLLLLSLLSFCLSLFFSFSPPSHYLAIDSGFWSLKILKKLFLGSREVTTHHIFYLA